MQHDEMTIKTKKLKAFKNNTNLILLTKTAWIRLLTNDREQKVNIKRIQLECKRHQNVIMKQLQLL